MQKQARIALNGCATDTYLLRKELCNQFDEIADHLDALDTLKQEKITKLTHKITALYDRISDLLEDYRDTIDDLSYEIED